MFNKFLDSRKLVVTGLVVLVGLILLLLINLGVSASESAKAAEDTDVANQKIKELEASIVELEEKVSDAAPWFEMSQREQEELAAAEQAKIDAEEQKKAEEEAAKKAEEEKEKQRLAEEKAAEEEAERLKAEEEEKIGYDTGVTYDQLARTPDEFEGEKIKFSGEVLQVMEDEFEVQLRIAVDENYDNVIFAYYLPGTVDSRVLEGDYITVRGISEGLLTYESTMGGNITIPSMFVDSVE